MTEGTKRGVQSVDSTGILLEALCSFERAVPLKDVADYCAISPSKAHRYLTSLVRIGLASQDKDTGHYDLGPTALKLGVAALSRDDAIRRADRILIELTRQSKTTGHLSVWGEGGPVVIRVEHGGTPIVTSLGLGSFVPLLNSSAGHVFLSYMAEGATRKFVERARRQTVAQGETLPALRARVREAGFSRVDGTLVPGLSAMSGPILNFDGSLACVMTLVVLDNAQLSDNSAMFNEFISRMNEANDGVLNQA